MIDVVLATYDLELIIIGGNPKILILPFVRKSIDMMLQDDEYWSI